MKANESHRARLNAKGFKQVDGVHYDGSIIHSPVVADIAIRLVMILGLMAGWDSQIVEVIGEFLNGELDNIDQMYMYVPQGFENTIPKKSISN